MRIKLAKFHILFGALLALLFLFVWAIYRVAPESAPVARGAAYAGARACIDCHGDPQKPLADIVDENCSNTNQKFWHPEYDVECGDVLAYFEVIRLFRNSEDRVHINSTNPLAAGEQLARKYHCFQCHGRLGQGGFKNAKSLKGYVPGFFGTDFNILTRNADPDSVRQWIMNGMDPAVLKKPIVGQVAEFFFSRQAVKMPSFKSLDPEEIDILVNYVISLNKFGPMTTSVVRSYGQLSQSTDGVAGINIGTQLASSQPVEISP